PRIVVHPQKGNRQFFIWCDESDSKGRFYSNFYGGVLVQSEDLEEVNKSLLETCEKLHFNDEIKWQKVSEHYLAKYEEIMDVFFELVKMGKIKVRIMFSQKGTDPANSDNKIEGFFKLYFQFVRDAFGFAFTTHDEDVYLRLHFDYLTTTDERRDK